MLPRASVIWLGLVVLAIGNGALREYVISPRAGAQVGHVLSTILLYVLIAAVAWLAIPWIAPSSRNAALVVGGWWLIFTLGFEFLAGHYLFSDSWAKLLAEYYVARGRV